MRALTFAAAFSLGMAVALPALAGRPHLHRKPGKAPTAEAIPLRIRIAPEFRQSDSGIKLRLQSDGADGGGTPDIPAVSIGPLRARLGGTDKPRIARYRLEGVTVLGGSVSGTVDGRGARVFLRWPPGDDDDK
jgi:hypothetical protein